MLQQVSGSAVLREEALWWRGWRQQASTKHCTLYVLPSKLQAFSLTPVSWWLRGFRAVHTGTILCKALGLFISCVIPHSCCTGHKREQMGGKVAEFISQEGGGLKDSNKILCAATCKSVLRSENVNWKMVDDNLNNLWGWSLSVPAAVWFSVM